MKRSSNEIKIGEALKELIDAYKIEGKLNEVKVYEAWEKTLGSAINNHTTKIFMRGDELHVYLDSAALKNELSYSKSKLIESLNEYVGGDVVKDIVIH